MIPQKLSSMILRERSVRAFAQKVGVSPTAVAKWLKGGDMTVEHLNKVAQAYDLELSWFFQEPQEEGTIQVPMYDVRASAGAGLLIGREHQSGTLPFARSFLERAYLQADQLLALEAEGDSMAPTLESGDLLLVDRSRKKPKDGKIYVLTVSDTLLVKRLHWDLQGGLMIQSDNPAYPDRQLPAKEVTYLAVVGEVVWFGRFC
jgi:phage repressor protein C with HTH and peptisase S24 domain